MTLRSGERIESREPPRNLWRDAALGMAAGAVGVVAMNAYWRALAAAQAQNRSSASDEVETGASGEEETDGSGRGEPEAQGPASAETEQEGPLDDIALVGPFHREGESAPETLGRVAYTRLSGREPSGQTRSTLATQIHWGTGMALGGLYGLLRGDARNGLDAVGGLLFGAGAWFTNDEVLVPVLGLAAGPTAQAPTDHAKALGAHLAFGLATAAAGQTLEKVL